MNTKKQDPKAAEKPKTDVFQKCIEPIQRVLITRAKFKEGDDALKFCVSAIIEKIKPLVQDDGATAQAAIKAEKRCADLQKKVTNLTVANTSLREEATKAKPVKGDKDIIAMLESKNRVLEAINKRLDDKLCSLGNSIRWKSDVSEALSGLMIGAKAVAGLYWTDNLPKEIDSDEVAECVVTMINFAANLFAAMQAECKEDLEKSEK